jgi:hypothetical protein
MRPPAGGAGWGGSGSSPQAVARYLIGLRPILADACAERTEWMRQLGLLIEHARSGNALRVARAAGQLGRDFAERFRVTRTRVEQLNPPVECDLCQASVRAWAAALHGSCAALTEVGRTGQLAGLRHAQEQLAEARVQARRFNEEYARLTGELRKRVAIARRNVATLPSRKQAQPS